MRLRWRSTVGSPLEFGCLRRSTSRGPAFRKVGEGEYSRLKFDAGALGKTCEIRHKTAAPGDRLTFKCRLYCGS